MPEEVQPDDSGAAEGTSPEGPSSRSETLEAELARLEAMLPPDDPASQDPHGDTGSIG